MICIERKDSVRGGGLPQIEAQRRHAGLEGSNDLILS